MASPDEEHDNAVTAARRLLKAIANRSDEAQALAHKLAILDIEGRGGALALDVLEGDTFALARAVQLAEEHLRKRRDRAVAQSAPLPRVSARDAKRRR